MSEVEYESAMCLCSLEIRRPVGSGESAWVHTRNGYNGKHRCDPEVSGRAYGQDAAPAVFAVPDVRFCKHCNDPVLEAPVGWTHFSLEHPELRYCDPAETGQPFGVAAEPRARMIGDGIRETIARRVLRVLESREAI